MQARLENSSAVVTSFDKQRLLQAGTA